MKLKTYFLSKSLGYISIPGNLELSDKITIDHLGQSVVLELDDGTDLLLVIKAFLGETKEESGIKTRNWFTSRKLDINNLENWYFSVVDTTLGKDMSNFARMFKTYKVENNMTNYTADEFFNLGTGNVVLCGSTKFFFQAMRANKLLTFNHWIVTMCGSWGHSFDLYDNEKLERNYDQVKLLHFHKIYQSHVAVIVTDESGYIGDSTKKEIEFIEKLGIPYFWFNGKEFSGETTVVPKDHLSSYLPIMEDINNGTFEV